MIKTENKKKVCIYVRVSSDEQAKEGLSIEAQTKKLQDYCEVKDYWVFKIYTDAGYSGGSINRPAFKQMLEDAKNKKFSMIVVFKLDRFSRNIIDTLFTLNELNSYGIEFNSITESFDTSTASGMAFMKIVSVLSELERDQTRERVNMVFEKKIGEGFPVIPAPYGYKYGKNKNWVVEKKKSDIVKKVCENYLNKINYKITIDELKIDKNLYYKIISNIKKGVYSGWIVYNKKLKDVRGKVTGKEEIKYRGSYDPIISEELFRKVNS